MAIASGSLSSGTIVTPDTSFIQNSLNHANRPWQKGDPIVEPQGFYQLANGHLVMSREYH